MKEIVFAAVFGVSRATDLFVLAFTYAVFLPQIVAAAIATALVAQLSGRNGALLPAPDALRGTTRRVLACAAAAAGLTYVFAPAAMGLLFRLEGAELDEAVLYARVLAAAPSLVKPVPVRARAERAVEPVGRAAR